MSLRGCRLKEMEMRRGWLHTPPGARMALRGYRLKEMEMRRGWLHTPL